MAKKLLDTEPPKPHPSCTVKHTKYQVSDAEWSCPRCGEGNEHFTIEMSADGSHPDCAAIHVEDEVYCTNCKYGWSGESATKALMKKHNRVCCPTCKGAGTVPAPKSKEK